MGLASELENRSNIALAPSSLEGRQALLIGLAIFLLNFGLKMLFIDAQAIANDEPFTLFWAQKSLGEIWELAKHENNPPLHFLLQHFWLKAFGWSVAAIRLPSVLMSSLTAMLIFRSGNRHFGLFAGILAAILLTLSTEHVYYSHEARSYALLSLLSIAAIDRYLRLLHSPENWKNYLYLGIFNVLLIYTHFLGIWILLAQVILWPLIPDRKATFKGLFLMFLGVGIAYSPNFYPFYLRLQSVSAEATWVPKPHWTQLYGHINIFLNGPAGTICLLIPLTFGLIWMLIGKKSRQENFKALLAHRSLLIVAFMFAVIYGGMYLQSLVLTASFIPRYLIFTSIPFFLALAAALDFMLEGIRIRIGILILIVAGLLVGFQLNPSNFRDAIGMATFVSSEKTEITPLIICPSYLDKTYTFHADRALFHAFEHFPEACRAKGIYAIDSIPSLNPAILRDNAKIIYLDAAADTIFPRNGILKRLRAEFPQEKHQHFDEAFDVYIFSR